MLGYVVLCFAVLAGVHGDISDDDKKALRALLKPIDESCMEKFGVDPAKFAAGIKTDMDPCILACVYKETGVMDANGMFVKDGSMAFIKKVVTNTDSLKDAAEIGNVCEKVNKEDVNDGADGCERAALLAKCFHELKSEVILH